MIIEHLYLIFFTYDYYCQGYENAQITVLVEAPDFYRATQKIINTSKYLRARDFKNMTVGEIRIK